MLATTGAVGLTSTPTFAVAQESTEASVAQEDVGKERRAVGDKAVTQKKKGKATTEKVKERKRKQLQPHPWDSLPEEIELGRRASL